MTDDELLGLLDVEARAGEGVVWELCLLDGADAAVRLQVAALLAARIVTGSCPPHVAELWQPDRQGDPLGAEQRELLLVYLGPKLGRPDAPPAEGDQRAQSYVAEFLWYEFMRHRPPPDQEIVRAEGPSFDPTDPGGDGLIVYRTAAGALAFRLWEIKKHTAQAAVATTVRRAHDQLHTRALSYLGRYSLGAQQLADEPELKEFYATLVDQWQAADPGVGVGVAVATSFGEHEDDCFESLPDRFPQLDGDGRRAGLLAGLWDYARFVELVQEQVWKGL